MGVGIGPARVDASLNYSEKNGFSGSVGASIKLGDNLKIGGQLTYSREEGFGATASVQAGNYRAGVGYTENSGASVFAGMTNDDGTKTVGFSYSQKSGVEAYAKVGNDSGNAKISYSQSQGFGASVTSNISSTTSASASFTQRGGLTLSATQTMSTALSDGFRGNASGTISYNTKTGFSASAGLTLTSTSPEYKDGKFTTSDNGSVSGNVTIDRTGSHGSTSVNTGANLGLITSLATLESSLDEQAQKNRAAVKEKAQKAADEQFKKDFAGKIPGVENMSPDEIAAARKTLAKDHGVSTDPLADGTSRESIGSKLLGTLSDIGNIALGNNRGGGQDYFIDEDGKYHQRTCFTKGTLVLVKPDTAGAILKEGKFFKKIEEIKEGDFVLSWNEKTGMLSYNKVTQTFVRKTDLIYTIAYKDNLKLETTWNHRFWIADKGWIEAKDLTIGDKSLNSIGALSEIDTISHESKPETVYNFEVEGNHTYFVGENGILVHNDAYNFTYQNGQISSVRANLMGKEYDSSKGDNISFTRSEGNVTVSITDEFDNSIQSTMPENPNTSDYRDLFGPSENGFSGTWSTRSTNLVINNSELMDGGIVSMNSQNGRLNVTSNVPNGSQVLVLGQNNDGLDSLTSLNSTRNETNRTTYMVYNPTRGGTRDTYDSAAIRNGHDNITQRPAIMTVANTMTSGSSNTYICHSQGGAICANAANVSVNGRNNLRDTNIVYVGGAQSFYPNTNGRQISVLNSNDYVIRPIYTNPGTNHRTGHGDGHNFNQYLNDIRCQSQGMNTVRRDGGMQCSN